MGYICHHAIIVTAWNEDHAEKAHAKATEMADSHGLAIVSPLSPKQMNGYRTFLIGPDGSKEGWDHSLKGDYIRRDFIEWAISDDGGYLDWAEVQYGDEDNDNWMPRHSVRLG